MEAAMAWIGMRPPAISWPPARRAAEANGAAQVFSQTRIPATLPGSIAAAKWTTSSVEVVDLKGFDRSVRGLLEDQQVENSDGPGL
jgi:hypothetical protein